MGYFTLYAVSLLMNIPSTGSDIDYTAQMLKIKSFETRQECEYVRGRLLETLPAPAGKDLRCIKTDET